LERKKGKIKSVSAINYAQHFCAQFSQQDPNLAFKSQVSEKKNLSVSFSISQDTHINMPKASKSRSKKIDTPLRQRKFAVPEKQVLEKIVTDGDEITVSTTQFL
jgi:hypothetical protein